MIAESLTLLRLFPEPLQRVDVALPLTIGRLATCGLRLVDDDVSRVHALIEMRGDDLVIVDQGSRNGVYLRGRRVGVARLEVGVTIRLGQTVLWCGPRVSTRSWLDARIAMEAARATPLLIVGEVGAGRRTIARRIHRASQRMGPLLFADGPPDAALLRAAASGAVVFPVASGFAPIGVAAAAADVRVFGVAGVGDPAAGEDVGVLRVPPLRERMDELGDALRTFLSRAPAAGRGVLFAPPEWNADFVEALACHPFAMNFAELEVVCASLAPSRDPLGIQHLPQSVRANVVEARNLPADDLSRERLHDALTRHRGNVRRVAQELGLQRGQLYRVLAGFGLNPDLYRGLVSPVEAPSATSGDERRTLS